MVLYSHLLETFPQFVVIQAIKGFGVVNKAEVDAFLELLLFRWSYGCWQADLWFLLLMSSFLPGLLDLLLIPLFSFSFFFLPFCEGIFLALSGV